MDLSASFVVAAADETAADDDAPDNVARVLGSRPVTNVAAEVAPIDRYSVVGEVSFLRSDLSAQAPIQAKSFSLLNAPCYYTKESQYPIATEYSKEAEYMVTLHGGSNGAD